MYEAQSGRGPGEGFLTDTGWGNGMGVCGKLQMLQDLPDDLTVRDGGDDSQRPPLTERAARHVKRKDALEQPRPVPARRPRVRLLLVRPLLAWRRDDGPAPEQAFQLVPPMRGDVGVGVQRKPVDAGTAGAVQVGRSPS